MKTKKLINVDQKVVDKLLDKYPGVSFTKLMEMGMDLLLLEMEDPFALKHVQSLILGYNQHKQSYREFKDETDNRLIALETKLK